MGRVVNITDPVPTTQPVQVVREDDRNRITSTIWRRHTPKCALRSAGRNAMNCDCPLWGDGYVNTERVLRKSLNTRNLRIGRNRLAGLLDDYLNSLTPEQAPQVKINSTASIIPVVVESSSAVPVVPIPEDQPAAELADAPGLLSNAVPAFISSCKTNGVKPPTLRKYRNSMRALCEFVNTDSHCKARKVCKVKDLVVTDLDRFRAWRKIATITSLKELETLRQFWAFCTARDHCPKNIAALIKAPKIVDQNDIVPYTPEEVQAIIDACSTFGQCDYERMRAHALVLCLRHTALRISDVALMRRDRISSFGDGWRIFLRTTKNNAPVFLPVPREMVEALKALPRPRGSREHCPYYFWNGNSKPKSQISEVSETLSAVFKKSGVEGAGAHRFRHTLATQLLGAGASFEEVADILGNSPEIVRKHYAKWSKERQERVDGLMQKVHPDSW